MSNKAQGSGASTAVGAITPIATTVEENGRAIAQNIHPPNNSVDSEDQVEGFFSKPKNIHPPGGTGE